MGVKTIQLAWPFALIGATIGAELPSASTAAPILALVFGTFGALISSALERVRDWQLALLCPAIGAATGATLGLSLQGLDGCAVGLVAGLCFGLLTLSPLLLLTDGARRAHWLHPGSPLGRAQRRRLWLMTLATGTLATLVVPALTNSTAHPSEGALAQLGALGTMMLAAGDAALWLALWQPGAARRMPLPAFGNPYRDPPPRPAPENGAPMWSILAVESLLYDALVVAVLAGALLILR